jgi:hypothetical protein
MNTFFRVATAFLALSLSAGPVLAKKGGADSAEKPRRNERANKSKAKAEILPDPNQHKASGSGGTIPPIRNQ